MIKENMTKNVDAVVEIIFLSIFFLSFLLFMLLNGWLHSKLTS